MTFRGLVTTTTVAGRVVSIDEDSGSFTLECRSDDLVEVFVGITTTFEVLTNLDAVARDRTVEADEYDGEATSAVGRALRRYIAPDTIVFVRGIYAEYGEQRRFDSRIVYLLCSRPGEKYVFEETHWWLAQIARLADRWLDDLFDARRDYTVGDFARLYRTNLNIVGLPEDDTLQECATLSRLIYGLSSAYLLTGAERYFLAARAAVAYQRQAFRTLSSDGDHCFWAFGRRKRGQGERLLAASEFADDVGTIPLYEQIYALAGLGQYYRITADWEVLEDIRRTLNTFDDFYRDDPEAKSRGFAGTGGYYSHIDHVSMRPDIAALGANRSRKNWNSIGDHIPAYLINLVLSLDPLPQGAGRSAFDQLRARSVEMLDELVTLIIEKFPDDDSDYVNERFHADWTPDHEYSWQQNRAIVGHNLKIAWNLTRCGFYLDLRAHQLRDRSRPSDAEDYERMSIRCRSLARQLGDKMADVGVDALRGGVFDAVERQPDNGLPVEFVWGCTKDFWQQEQGILAYLILYGATQEERYLELARECMAFWNLFFLDRDRQGIYFRTTETGLPVIEGIYGQKGGHSVSGYHAFELSYLAHLYVRSYVEDAEQDRCFCLYFRVSSNREQQTINVLPDFMPPSQVEVRRITANGVDRTVDLKPEGADNFQIRIDNVAPNPRDGTVDLAVEFKVYPMANAENRHG